jgi:uncharacterized membrane protein YqjE
MAASDESIADLIKGAIADARDLIHAEVALARAELTEEVARMRAGLVAIVVAATMAVLALIFLLFSVAWALSAGLDWPVWAGFAVVTLALALGALVLGLVGRRRFVGRRHMPRTVDTLKENLEWMRTRTPS